MSSLPRFARAVPAAAIAASLALGLGAVSAAAAPALSLNSATATVPLEANVTLTARSAVAINGTVTFETSANDDLGSYPIDGYSLTESFPARELASAAGPVTIAATFSDGHSEPVPEDDIIGTAETTLTIEPNPSLYVADYGSDAITIYGSATSGQALWGTISGPATQLDYPEGVALDQTGALYVANSLGNTITEYAPGASGNATPTATISGPQTGLDDPRFIALDSSGDLYAVDAGSNTVTEYAPGAAGNVTPIATITGSDTGIDDPIGIDIDPSGRIYVSNAGDNSITAFAPGSNGDVAPVWMLQGDQTQLAGPKGLALNVSGVLFVANDSGPVTEYSTGWQGNRPPSGELSGPLTELANSEQVLLDPTDNMLLVDSLTEGTITSYTAGEGGNIAPATTIEVGAGSQPTQMALNPLEP